MFSILLGSPQYYVTPDDSPFPSTGSGIASWSNYNRYGAGASQGPFQYYPSSSGAFDTQSLSSSFYPNQNQPSLGFYPQQSTTGLGSTQLTPASLDALLMRPLLVIDSQVFAMYELIKCWERHGELKKCVKLIEKCDQLFKKKSTGGDDDDDKKKGKKSKKSKGKKGKRTKKKNPDSENADSQEDDKDDENADEDDEENDEEE